MPMKPYERVLIKMEIKDLGVNITDDGRVLTDYLIYKGNKVNGTITVGNMKPSSPFRYFKFSKGGRYQIGKDVRPKVAEWFMKYHKEIFGIEREEVSGEQAFVVAFSNLLSLYMPVLRFESIEEFLPLLEQGFKKEGEGMKIRKVIPRAKKDEAEPKKTKKDKAEKKEK